ncbi:MAG: ATP-binding protein [Phycisphaerales bacterium]
MLALTVIQGPDKGKTFDLPAHEPQLVGRSSEALPMTDNTVSRRHAELTPDDGRWWIRDLGSQNGTWVNGVRIEQRTQLKLGDQIRVGATLLVYGKSERPSASAPGRIRLLRASEADTAFERTLPSNEDSVILPAPEQATTAGEHLRVIYRVTTLTSRPASRQELLEGVLDLVFSELRPERGFVILTGEEQGETPAPAVVRFAAAPVGEAEQIAVSRTILNHALRHAEGVLCSNARTDPRFKAGDSVQQLDIRSAICSPIRFRERTFGAIYIDSSMANTTFTDQQLALLNAIGQHTGMALANAELYTQKLHAERLAAVGETVASLSHSIKNILQGLRGGADVVEMGLKRNDLKVAQNGWSILKRNLDRIVSLTINMLAYSRPRTLELELTQVGRLLDDCAALMYDTCESKGVALILDTDQEVPPVMIDAAQMHQAIMNLLTNAVEAVESQTGVVTVRTEFSPGGGGGVQGSRPMLRISVIDNGPGIPREKLARVFEPFFSTKGLRGTGLGLAVSKRVAELHAGRIDVQTQSGKGATFTLSIPADLAAGADPSETHHPRPGSSSAEPKAD